MNNMNNLDTALLDISYLRHDAHSICKKNQYNRQSY